MKKGILILVLTVLISPVILSGLSFADQDPNDPYGPDSVLFRSRELLVPCPPEVGQAFRRYGWHHSEQSLSVINIIYCM